jgi:hypothetical protein
VQQAAAQGGAAWLFGQPPVDLGPFLLCPYEVVGDGVPHDRD